MLTSTRAILEKFYVTPAKNPAFGNTVKPVKDEIAFCLTCERFIPHLFAFLSQLLLTLLGLLVLKGLNCNSFM